MLTDAAEKWLKLRNGMFLFLVIVSQFCGAVDLLMYDEGWLSFAVTCVGSVILAFAGMLWCVYDGRIRGVPVSTGLRVAIVLIGIFGVAYYFHRSRSRRDALRAGYGLFLFVAELVPYYYAWYVLRFILTKTGYYS